MSTDLLLSAREVDDGPSGGRMALLSTAVTLVLLLGAGVWWVATSHGGGDGVAVGAVTATGGAAARAAGTAKDAGAGAASAPAEGKPFYFLLVDTAAQAVAVREQWDESNRRRVLRGLPELDGSVFMVGPGDDMEWLYRNVAYTEEGALRRGRSGVEVLDLREGGVVTAGAGPDSRGCEPECLDAVGGLAELYREQGGGR